MYRVFIERRAEKDLNALDHPLRKRIVKRLLLFRYNPRPPNAKKLTGLKTAWRLRLGDWRVLYEINDKNKEVKIYRVKHRSRAY